MSSDRGRSGTQNVGGGRRGFNGRGGIDGRGGGRGGIDARGGCGGRAGANEGLPIIKGQDSRYCPFCTTVVWEYKARVKCPACKKHLPKNPPTLPTGHMWCGECSLVSVSVLHACCQMCGWETPLGKKIREAVKRSERKIVALQQRFVLEIEEIFKEAEVEVERVRQEEIEMETEADRVMSQVEE